MNNSPINPHTALPLGGLAQEWMSGIFASSISAKKDNASRAKKNMCSYVKSSFPIHITTKTILSNIRFVNFFLPSQYFAIIKTHNKNKKQTYGNHGN